MLIKNENKAPVMILFFNRPDTLRQVFDAVKKYQPKQLFLVQDGARIGRLDDVENIKKCRKIVEDIDWECKVYQNYSEENMSCDYREYTGIDWCFQYVDKLIILEDDCVPVQGFFQLCEECLDKYENETNIFSIYGFNRVGVYDCPYDYVFSKSAAGIGWATWKRAWNKVSMLKNSDLFDDETCIDYINKVVDPSVKEIYGNFISYCAETKKKELLLNKTVSWENWCGLTLILNDMLTIVPKRNMIRYVGISKNATHASDDPRLLPHKIAKLLTQNAYESEEIISHPPYMIRDTKFEKLSSKTMRINPFFAKSEHVARVLIYQGLKEVFSLMKKKLRKERKTK